MPRSSLANAWPRSHPDGESGHSKWSPPMRSVTLFRTGSDLFVVLDAGNVAIGPEVPGFVLDAGAVFDASDREF